MLKHRIIPVLLFDNKFQCVKPVSFGRPYRKLGPIEQYIKVMEKRNIDEIILLDITATAEGRHPDPERIKQLTSGLFCPVTYGGGISTLEHIRICLANGADKVAICSNKSIIKKASEKFGKQAIVGVVETGGMISASVEDCFSMELCGAGEILLIDKEQDGTMDGYNLSLIKMCTWELDVPLIICGGCKDPLNMVEAINAGASAVAAGAMFLYTEKTPTICARELHTHKIPVRMIAQ